MTEPNNRKGPGSAPGPNPIFSHNEASDDSAVIPLVGVCGSCSLRSSSRTIPSHPLRELLTLCHPRKTF